jgi:hypothetical protein
MNDHKNTRMSSIDELQVVCTCFRDFVKLKVSSKQGQLLVTRGGSNKDPKFLVFGPNTGSLVSSKIRGSSKKKIEDGTVVHMMYLVYRHEIVIPDLLLGSRLQ